MQAIILAAGMGKRLKDLTADNTKCMVKVNGETLIERGLRQLDSQGLDRIVIVVGYMGQKLIRYISTLNITTPIVFVDNPIYDKTNNIYSLFLAKEYLLEQDTLLLESDLIIEDGVLESLIENPYPSLALVAKYESWMDGTVITLDEEQNIISFLDKNHFCFSNVHHYYKTVNIYKFSKEFSNSHYVPFLEAYSKALGDNEYYEQVLKVIALLDKPEIKALVLEGKKWYEIDDVQDLDIAESMFAKDPSDRYNKLCSRYGGYWRYPNLLDYCYLVNPYYPPTKLVEEMQASFDVLLRAYPSGQKVNNLLAANYYGLHASNVIVGNGAAELIKGLIEMTEGRIGMVSPSFDEYRNRCKAEQLCVYTVEDKDFSYTVDDLITYFSDKDLSTLLLINPDNPSGNYIPYAEVLRLVSWAQERTITLIVDESFSDFVDSKDEVSLLDQSVLEQYSNLVVIKSISKSYGVPGVRLGILATTDKEVLAKIAKQVSIWNINSYGEFFMQIWNKYKAQYASSLTSIIQARKSLMQDLGTISYLKALPSQANYIMCEVLGGKRSFDLAVELFDKHNIFIKDLSTKKGIAPKQFIRLAVRDEADNGKLVKALQEMDR
ncbi:MAG: aminotransferase class I/II-fold pyridoxal phosphate-dependent enzyme [Sphaerochaeta sp.]|nr:aminotransferase class I/II-fold pyridoxal phosphate-dependent enzyme [Sphaerochaeta sp.]